MRALTYIYPNLYVIMPKTEARRYMSPPKSLIRWSMSGGLVMVVVICGFRVKVSVGDRIRVDVGFSKDKD